jgi:hypothetical protein
MKVETLVILYQQYSAGYLSSFNYPTYIAEISLDSKNFYLVMPNCNVINEGSLWLKNPEKHPTIASS